MSDLIVPLHWGFATIDIGTTQSTTASCKTCGGKPLGDGRGASSSSMLGTISLEHTGFIGSDLTWKGSKGIRSKSRRAKKSVSRILKGCGKLVNNKPETLDMTVSESEKHGVNVLRCRFSERAEHVPIKKRRFVYRSPSPSPRSPSPHSGENESERLLKIKPGVIDCTASANDTGQIVDKECDVDETNMVRVNRQVENEDFSGISILASAACSKGLGGEGGNTEESSRVEESYLREGPFEVSTNNESHSVSKGISKDDLTSAEMSTEGISCISAVPQEEITACLRTGQFSANLSHRNNVEDNFVQDHPVTVSKDLLTNREEERKRKFSSQEVRLHWDLNTVMGSWKRPSGYEFAVSKTNATKNSAEDGGLVNCSDKMRTLEGYELQSCPDDNKTVAEKELPHSDSREMAHEWKLSTMEEHKSEQEIFHSSLLDCAVKPDHFNGKEPLDSKIRISIGGGSVDFVPAGSKRHSASINDDKSASDHSVSVGCTGTSDGLSSHGVGIMVSHSNNNPPFKPDCCTSACVANSGTFSSSGSQAEKREVAYVVALSGNSTGERLAVLNKNVDEAEDISCSKEETNLPNDMDALDAGQPLKMGPLDGVTENSVCSFSGVQMPTSGALTGAQPASAVDLKVQHDKVYAHDSPETDILLVDNGKEPATKCIEKSAELSQTPSVYSNHEDPVNSADAMALEEPTDNGDYSDVSRDHAHAKFSELEVDYDSQYEDGEVRESMVCAWEECDGEDMEAEHVDYGSDNASNMGYEAENIMKNTQESNFQPSFSGSSGSAKERPWKGKDGRNEVASGDETGPYKVTRDFGVGVVPREDDVKKPSLSAESTLKLTSWSRRNFSHALTGVKEVSSRKNLSDDCKDVLVRSREFRRGLRSCIEGPPLHDAYSNVKTYMQGNSDADNASSRAERGPEYVKYFGRGRYNLHAYARCQGDDHWANYAGGRRGIKHYHSPKYHGLTSFRRSGPENGSIGRQDMDASSFGVHRRLTRSGSPVDGEEAFRLRSGFRPSRELSPGRCVTFGRGRSQRYDPQMDGRGPRGRYHRPRPMPGDCSEPFLNHSHLSTKRERCFSPIDRRGKGHAHRPHSKSPSRSRTRSPNSGNRSLRHRSKSPNFKFERMQRVKSPHQWPGFLADRMVGYRSMCRSHGSPPHNSRWIGDRRDGVVHFREQGFNQRSSVLDRRSPSRFGPQNDRFDLVDSPRYRSMHPGRFSKIDGVGRGRFRRDGSDDNRGKNSYRFGLVPPAKRYDIDGDSKRFRNNIDDGFVKARDSHFDDASSFNDRQDLRNSAGGLKTTRQEDLEKREDSYMKESENMLAQNQM